RATPRTHYSTSRLRRPHSTHPFPYTPLFRSSATGAVPQTMSDVLWRQKQIQYASRTATHIDAVATKVNLQQALVATASMWVAVRSEEHTSELQSHLNLVCRLLLENKKQNNT